MEVLHIKSENDADTSPGLLVMILSISILDKLTDED